MDQRTDEWFNARLGKVTASRISDVMAKTKSGWGASRANYMAELIVERLTGQKGESYQNAAMMWGTNTEPLARAAYEAHRGVLVEETGFVPHPSGAMTGASPDGLVEANGLVEIKCPNTATHIDTLMMEEFPSKYFAQMQWQMACTGRAWCDFVSFDPRMPEPMQLFMTLVDRDQTWIDMAEASVHEFLEEMKVKLNKLMEKYNGV